MSKDINILKPDFRLNIKRLYSRCKKEGFTLLPFYTERDVYEQAKLYRQSRPWKEIKFVINHFKIEKALFLAKVLEEAGPQYGLWATNAPPGLSWHQWGEAVDSFLLINGKAVWKDSHEGYWVYHREAIKLGLHSSYGYGDRVHIQKRYGKPTYFHSVRDIDRIMRKKYEKN
jgi:hypothetical protein